MTAKTQEQAVVAAVILGLVAVAVLPFTCSGGTGKPQHPIAVSKDKKHGDKDQGDHNHDGRGDPADAKDDLPSDGTLAPGDSRKGAHGHDLEATDAHWYLTVHGTDELANVFAIDGNGRVIGGILGRVNPPEDHLAQLRGICLLGDGRLAVVNAYMANSRVLLFGAPDDTGVRPFQRVWIRQDPTQNPAFVHPYQIATSPDGTLYASNQDTNTVTRYRGLGSPQAGQAIPMPASFSEFGTLPPGTIVPNSQHAPQGLHEERGIAWGPDNLLYVADRSAQEVVRWDPTTGERVSVVMDKSQGLGHPIQLLFTPDRQYLLVGDNWNHCVWRVDLTTNEVHQLVKPKAGGLNATSSLAIEGSKLYVGSRMGKSILRYKLRSGEFVDEFAHLQANPEFLISTQQK